MTSPVLIELRAFALQLADGRELLSPASLRLDARPVALVGINGVGKSRLCQALCAGHGAAGQVLHHTSVRALPDVPAAPDARVTDLLADVLGEPALWTRMAELGLDALDLSSPLSTLSGGELMRFRLAGVFVREYDYLLLDEPDAHLDATARDWLHSALCRHRGGVLFVSHQPETLACAQRVVELSGRRLHDYSMGFDAYRLQREHEVAAQGMALRHAREALKIERERSQRARERAEQRAAHGRRERARGSHGPLYFDFVQGRAEAGEGRREAVARQREAELRATLDAERERLVLSTRLDLRLADSDVPAGRRVLQLSGMSVERGGRVLLRDVDVMLRGRQRLAILGPNGSGKSSLLQVLRGQLQPATGVVEVAATRCVYIDQAATLPAAASVLALMRDAQPGTDESRLREMLDAFGFPAPRALQSVNGLSAGERMRLLLCAHLAGDVSPDLLLLDEPESALDLASRAIVQSALGSWQGALVLVSHSEVFVRACGVRQVLRLDGRGAWCLEELAPMPCTRGT